MSSIRAQAVAATCRALRHTHPDVDGSTGQAWEECPYQPPNKELLAEDHGTLGSHQPRRGSDVESYLQRWRDDFEPFSVTYQWLDHMLDDYRLRADYGRGLADPTEGLE